MKLPYVLSTCALLGLMVLSRYWRCRLSALRLATSSVAVGPSPAVGRSGTALLLLSVLPKQLDRWNRSPVLRVGTAITVPEPGISC